MKGIVVAIDGPSGSGKSTIARLAAKKLGYKYLDTGAMYRAVALAALEKKVDLEDGKKLGGLARSLVFTSEEIGDVQRFCVNGEDVSEKIRTPEIDRWVSLVASHREVREHLVRLQREMGKEGHLVCEGRDIGTVVFPDSPVKFFVTASSGERALRRKRQLGRVAEDLTQEEIKKEIERRDGEDSSRDASPLVKASDAVVLDTTELTIEEEVNGVVEAVRRATARAS
jgi:cytidylate kinase